MGLANFIMLMETDTKEIGSKISGKGKALSIFLTEQFMKENMPMTTFMAMEK